MTVKHENITAAEWQTQFKEQNRRKRAVVKALLRSITDDCRSDYIAAINQVELVGAWPEVMRGMTRLKAVPAWLSELWHGSHLQDGEHMRDVVGDLTLADAYRRIFQPYQGPAQTIWRGESAWNRRRQTYGLSWTTSREVAEGFARARQEIYQGGTVLLRTEAPVEAIIWESDDFGEAEVMVDRRRLGKVELVERYAFNG